MKESYLPTDRNGRLFHLVEECGEVIKAVGKLGRWGAASRWPLKVGPMNVETLLSELADLEGAIRAVRPDLEAEKRTLTRA